jgi:hypothetical protein
VSSGKNRFFNPSLALEELSVLFFGMAFLGTIPEYLR